ncbi:MAG: type II toxin-antitoxin system RelE/ParE family toxin [Planctomycetia bacterium]|nr:type II toxin-antitoxin system RelE/ParE family toxin [Planctomycetia bacterium]
MDLERDGSQLKRPLADYLRDGIRELRIRWQRVNYRMLYSFNSGSRNVAVITHGLTKEGDVPDNEIEFAIAAMKLVRTDPNRHTIECDL